MHWNLTHDCEHAMTICNITGYACDCQPDEGIPCDGMRKLREACESWKKQSIDRGQQIERLRTGLLAHACMCGPTDPDPAVHREDCPYRKWSSPHPTGNQT